MVTLSRFVALFLFLGFPLFGHAAVTVTAQVVSAIDGTPIEGIVTVTHDEKEGVNVQSFRMNNQPLKVDFIQDKKTVPYTSTYRFQLGSQPQGLYLLPSISVTVGAHVYSSPTATYQVLSISAPRASKAGNLALETFVKPATTLYPGQKLEFIYRIYYRTNIDLSLEELPLLDAKGFQKIGQKEINDLTDSQANVQEIRQKVKALDSGTFQFPPSVLEGYSYQEDGTGQRTYDPTKLHSETPAVTIDVLPFPEQDRPGSFDNAIGNYTFTTQLLSSSNLSVGDNIQLALVMSGKGEWETVTAPNLSCQPGFSGFFQVDNLPGEQEQADFAKGFKVELRPLTSTIHEIPAIEFSFFDPATHHYQVLHSNPIPIRVMELAAKEVVTEQEGGDLIPWKEAWKQALLLDHGFNGPRLPRGWIANWSVLWLVPVGMILLLLQLLLKGFLQHRKERVSEGMTLFYLALHDPTQFYFLVEKAFLLRLWEKRWIPAPVDGLEQLPTTGLTGEVRTFLTKVEATHYAGKEVPEVDLPNEAKKLFRKL